jgi:NDP-sugar pyrophosphorylase family protein
MVQIVIPMSGIGKRFVSAGYTEPKPLLVAGEKKMIEHVIRLFPGETNILAICNKDHLSVRHELESICPAIEVRRMPYRGLGPVDAVLYVEDNISDDEEVIVSYCDYGTEWDYAGFLKDARENDADGSIACYRGFHPHHLGPDCYAYVEETDKWASAIQEKKPFTDDKMSEYASNGTYYFKSGRIMKQYFWSLVHSKKTINGEFYVSMVYNHMLNHALGVRVFEIQKMLQWGTPRDLRIYNMWYNCFKSLKTRQRKMIGRGITVLPMAGRGSRFSMVGYQTPKPFLYVQGKPMLCAAIECLPVTSDLRVITLKEHPDVRPYLPSAKVIELEDVTDGQATTCMKALGNVADETSLTVTACDNGAIYNAERLRELMDDETIDCIVWAFTNNPTSELYPSMYAWLDVDESMRLKDVSVKKTFADRPNKYAIIGTMFFRRTGDFKAGYKHIVENDIRTNGEFYVDNLLKPLVDMGKKVVVFPVEYYLCWGTPNDYKTFNYWDQHFNNDRLCT